MKLAMIGLGKMGANMARRLIGGGHEVVGYNLETAVTHTLATEVSLIPAYSLAEAVEKLEPPRVAWVMVPAGNPTESVITKLSNLLAAGDLIVDGGNSNYKETMRRGQMLAEKGINFVDVGTSGGVWGLTEGYSMMVGGTETAVATLTPALKTLAPGAELGWGHVGPSGAGHFVKMIHNGIEYGLMQAYAEGFEIMKAKEEFDLDLHQISEIWRFGSVVRSWLLDLTANALSNDGDLSNIKGYVPDSGEGRWTVQEAIDLDIPAPIITHSLFARFVSRQDDSFAAKLLAAMRNQFGGHAVVKAD
ncbi:MAG: decarboxylating 6-phosphogluconate dehydrogenase [Ardenticatenaceae bacterium]|nr:decarboxylating 6-phosphogluconate dehydrogenase [Ardenticatenaceae bacterium]MCB8973620.1 decarboxylating 6-phosphogluconate dehydrogenase [Ardenticatenaceae bacterium]